MNKEFHNPAVRSDCLSIRSWRSIKNNHDVKVRRGSSTRREDAVRQECVTALGESFFNNSSSGNGRICDFHSLIMSVVTERMDAVSCWLMALKGNLRERPVALVSSAHPLVKPSVLCSSRVASGLRRDSNKGPPTAPGTTAFDAKQGLSPSDRKRKVSVRLRRTPANELIVPTQSRGHNHSDRSLLLSRLTNSPAIGHESDASVGASTVQMENGSH